MSAICTSGSGFALGFRLSSPEPRPSAYGPRVLNIVRPSASRGGRVCV